LEKKKGRSGNKIKELINVKYYKIKSKYIYIYIYIQRKNKLASISHANKKNRTQFERQVEGVKWGCKLIHAAWDI
jgi:hypothetical protein